KRAVLAPLSRTSSTRRARGAQTRKWTPPAPLISAPIGRRRDMLVVRIHAERKQTEGQHSLQRQLIRAHRGGFQRRAPGAVEINARWSNALRRLEGWLITVQAMRSATRIEHTELHGNFCT